MANKIKFSIIIPVKELNDYLRKSILKILQMNYKKYEIIILPNENPNTIPDYLKNKRINIMATGKKSPAIKRDIGAKYSNGEYLAFIDDDAYPEKNWLKVAEKILNKEKISAICGPAITPNSDSAFQKASGLFFETLFGGGGMSYRYRPAKNNFFVDDYPSVNFIVLKKAFFDVGGFDNEFWPGEDTKFCLDLTKKRYKILYCKDLLVYHHRRKNLSEHIRQVGNYGKHRGFFAKKFPETSFKFVYFMPSLFVLGNILLFALSFVNSFFAKLWLFLLLVYFVIVIMDIGLRAENMKIFFLTIIIEFLSHFSYGIMFLVGLLSRRFKSKLR